MEDNAYIKNLNPNGMPKDGIGLRKQSKINAPALLHQS